MRDGFSEFRELLERVVDLMRSGAPRHEIEGVLAHKPAEYRDRILYFASGIVSQEWETQTFGSPTEGWRDAPPDS
jgi:hypothetical protein